MSLIRLTARTIVLSKSITEFQSAGQARCFKRWVSPTLRELRRRARLLGPQEPQPRSGFIEWNYRAELFAFGKRLHEEFQMPLLQTAFTQRSYALQEEKRQRDLGVEEADIQIADNVKLAEKGQDLAKEYVLAYLQYSLPKVPVEGQEAFASYLLSKETLAHVASHLGMKDLVFSTEYPPSEEAMAQSLLAVIGALEESSGVERTFLFIRDFICTQLNQRDLLELWDIKNPEELLKNTCTERKLPEPEPRLLGECGRNTVLAAYHVGIYANKEMIGKGFGEDISTAIKTASIDALQGLFGIRDNARPFNFQLQVERSTLILIAIGNYIFCTRDLTFETLVITT